MKTEDKEFPKEVMKTQKFKFSGSAKSDYNDWLNGHKDYKTGIELIARYGNNNPLVTFFTKHEETPELKEKLVYNLSIISKQWSK